MRLATTIGDLKKYTHDGRSSAEAVRMFEGTGFRYLDYDFYNVIFPSSPFLSERWMEDVTQAAEAAASLGMRFVQAHSPNYNPFDPDADHEAGMLATLRSIEACGYLGIPNLVVHSGYTARLRYPQDREEYFAENRKFYESLLPHAERHNVNILIENSAEENMQGKYYFMTGQEMADFLSWVGHPLLHACWDIGHANMRGSNQYRDICDLGGHLKALHIQDNFGTYDEHFAPFMGTVDLDAVMQALRAVGYEGYFTFEANNILAAWGNWPHARRETPDLPAPRRLQSPDPQLRIAAETLLYKIGQFILTRYDCFEA